MSSVTPAVVGSGEKGTALTVAAQVASLPPISKLLGVPKKVNAPSVNAQRICTAQSFDQLVVNGAPSSAFTVPAERTNANVDNAANETCVWRRIWACLKMPASCRLEEDVRLAVRMLREVPFLHDLTDAELQVVMNTVDVYEVRKCGSVLFEMPAPASEEEGENDSNLEWAARAGAIGDQAAPLQQGVSTLPQQAGQGSLVATTAETESRPSRDGTLPASLLTSGQSGKASLAEKSRAAADPVVLILVEGKATLELPTAAGHEFYPVLPYDVLVNAAMLHVLPPRARYVTAEPCLLLRLSGLKDIRLYVLLQRAEKAALARQTTFLTRSLVVNLFEGCTAAEVERCARELLPLRLSTKQHLLREGAVSDRLFFLVEGNLIVTRSVDATTASSRASAQSTSGKRDAAPLSMTSADMLDSLQLERLQQAQHVMQVASLTEGELIGELGLIAYNPDRRPGEGTVWSAEYWRDALLHRFTASDVPLDTSHTNFLRTLRSPPEKSSPQDGDACSGQVGACDPSPSPSSSSPAAVPDMARPGSSGDTQNAARDVPNTPTGAQAAVGRGSVSDAAHAVLFTTPAPRLASVYAQVPSRVYSLSYAACRAMLPAVAVTRLREYAKGYPARDDLREQFERQMRWTQYKEEVLAEVMRDSSRRARDRAAHPPMLF